MSAREPDALGPWSVVVAEVLSGVETVLSGYGPMPRSGAEAALDLLGFAYDDDALVPFSLKVADADVTTLLRVSFGDDAVRDLALADQHLGRDVSARWARSDAEAPNPLAVSLPESPRGGAA